MTYFSCSILFFYMSRSGSHGLCKLVEPLHERGHHRGGGQVDQVVDVFDGVSLFQAELEPLSNVLERSRASQRRDRGGRHQPDQTQD